VKLALRTALLPPTGPRVALALSLLAASVPLAGYVTDLREGGFHGSAWEPRVKAIIDVSRTAREGGPWLAIKLKDRSYVLADRRVNDLGFSAFAWTWARATGHAARRTTLLGLNLALSAAALLALVAVVPGNHRFALVPVFLAVPLVIPLYRTADPLSAHGALGVIGIAWATAVAAPLYWLSALGLGAVLFAIHKVRSAYAFYAMLAACLACVATGFSKRSRAPLRGLALALFGFGLLEMPWRLALAARNADPRLVHEDSLGTHPIWVALIEGVGFSKNPWGIKPSDPWIATYLAERYGGDPVDLGTPESERRSRLAYTELLTSEPLALLELYWRRLPVVVGRYFTFGIAGGIAAAGAVAAALFRARRVPRALGVVAATSGVLAGVLFQATVVDTRLIYAYPLTFLSALGLSLGAVVACFPDAASVPLPEPGDRDRR
jgi:hypothetical protein